MPCLKFKLPKIWKQKKTMEIVDDFEEYVEWTYFNSDVKFGPINDEYDGEGDTNNYDVVYNAVTNKESDLPSASPNTSDKEEVADSADSKFCDIYSFLSSQEDIEGCLDINMIEDMKNDVKSSLYKDENNYESYDTFLPTERDLLDSVPNQYIIEEEEQEEDVKEDADSKFCNIYSWLSSQEESLSTEDSPYSCVDINQINHRAHRNMYVCNKFKKYFDD